MRFLFHTNRHRSIASRYLKSYDVIALIMGNRLLSIILFEFVNVHRWTISFSAVSDCTEDWTRSDNQTKTMRVCPCMSQNQIVGHAMYYLELVEIQKTAIICFFLRFDKRCECLFFFFSFFFQINYSSSINQMNSFFFFFFFFPENVHIYK